LFADKVAAQRDIPTSNKQFLAVHFGELSIVERFQPIMGCTPFWDESISPSLPLEMLVRPSCEPSFFFPDGLENGPSFWSHWTQKWWLVCEVRHDWHMSELVCNCTRPV
jgi:hypothetical protein